MGHTPKAAWYFIAWCALVQLLSPHRSLAQGDHRLVWRSIHSEHFDVHYHEPLGVAARMLLARAESINAKIETSLGLSLEQRVSLVLTDDDDSANGFANVIPYNSIRLRLVAPEDMSPLADYDDWIDTLLTHEHTHVVHLEQSGGIPWLIQRIFGRIYTPQHKLPGWFTEGLAVVQESAHTSGGRLRSTQFEMYLRMDALEQRQLPLSLVTFDGEPWPHGNVRYLYGGAFMSFLERRYGNRALGSFVREYGRRIIPFSLNRSLKRITGKTFVALYEEFLAELRHDASETKAALTQAGLREGRRVTFHAELARSPRFLSNGELVYAVADARHVPELRRLSLDERGRAQRVVRVAGSAQAAPIPGSGELLYSALDFYRGRYGFQELFRVGIEGGRGQRLSFGLRGREPDVARDGKQVTFVTHGAGTSHLEVAELSDLERTRRIVVRSRALEQVFTPRFSPDGARIAYSAWSRGGYRDIWVLELASGQRKRLTYDRAIDQGPVFSPDGKTLYFSSDRTGISNLYAYRFQDGSLEQLTNVLGGAYQPDVSPDGKTLVYVGYGAKGFDLYTFALEGLSARPAAAARERPEAAPWVEPAAVPSEPYAPYATLYPRAYELSSDDVGSGRRLLLSTSGADVVGFHAWSLRLAQDLNENKRTIDVAYSFLRPRFPLFIAGSFARDVLGLTVNERGHVRDARFYRLSIGSSFAFPGPLRSLVLRAQYTVQFSELVAPLRIAPDPNRLPPALPATGTGGYLTASLSHSTVQSQPFDISRSYGHSLSLWATYTEPYLGSGARAVALGWRGEGFLRFDFQESVLAVAYTGSWNTAASLGGYPAQIAPILDALVAGKSAPGDYARLRGYPLRGGDRLHVAQLEYRFLIVRINRGLATLPAFARRIHAALFSDAGDAYRGRFDVRRVGVGLGAELRLDWAGGTYASNYMLRAGIARGLTQGGVWQWYTTLAFPF